MAMDQQALLKEHAGNVRKLTYDDHAGLRAALQRAKMLVRKIVPDDAHYIEDIDHISFCANFAPCEPAYDLQCWGRGCEELASLLETIASQLDTFGDNTQQVEADSTIEKICDSFHQVARQLRSRHGRRPTLEVEDEYDVQDLLHAILRIFFDDVRPEEWAPSYAGKATRMDFLLKKEKIVIEVKKTRQGLKDGELGTQLIEDIARYKTHPDCSQLICFVYDPEGRIGNPRGLETDLNCTQGELPVKVFIRPSR
jgi:hypothetical protein